MEPEFAFEWPPTPDVVDRVLARIDDKPRRRIWPIFAVIAALLVPAGVATAVSEDLQDWLGLRHVDVQVGTPPEPIEAGPGIIVPVTLDEAGKIAGFEPVVPPRLGTPDSVRAVPGAVVMRFGDLRLYVVAGSLGDGMLIEKIIASGEDVVRVPEGAYFRGPHFFFLQTPDDEIVERRTAKRTLVIERDGLVLRLEGKTLTKDQALQLLRPD